MKNKFNKYCAEITDEIITARRVNGGFSTYEGCEYNPYDDLNQVEEKLNTSINDKDALSFILMSKQVVDDMAIKQAFRDFIISTMEKDNE